MDGRLIVFLPSFLPGADAVPERRCQSCGGGRQASVHGGTRAHSQGTFRGVLAVQICLGPLFLVPGDVVLVWGCWLHTYPHGCTQSINLTSLSSQTHGRKEVYLNAKGIGDIGAKLVGNELKKNTDCLSLSCPTPTPSSSAWVDVVNRGTSLIQQRPTTRTTLEP